MTDPARATATGALDVGRTLAERGNSRVAISFLERAIDDAPDDVERRQLLARAALVAGEPDIAVEQTATALELEPFDGATWMLRALALLLAGRALDAVAPARIAAELAPRTAHVFVVLARCLSATGRTEHAGAALARCRELGGPAIAEVDLGGLVALPMAPVEDDFWGRNERGLWLAQGGRYRAAVVAFAEASVLRPESGIPVVYVGDCLRSMFEQAWRWVGRCPPLILVIVPLCLLRGRWLLRGTGAGGWGEFRSYVGAEVRRRSAVPVVVTSVVSGVIGLCGLALDSLHSPTYAVWATLVVLSVSALLATGGRRRAS